jgi:formylglycine-generating enzyme required for sulfatase activity/predicted Ser/Thr protein kinase
VFCGKCGKPNADDLRFCVHCSADLSAQTPPRTGDTFDNAETLHGPVRPTSAKDTLDAAKTIDGTQIYEGRLLAARYKVQRRLGSGGMGEVWKAVDTQLDDMPVAIKVLPVVLARNAHSIKALKREAAVALKLTHPNICRLHTFQSDEDVKFLVMEYIDGRTLEELLDHKPDRRMMLAELLPIAQQIAQALDYAHGLTPAVLHRDIKPSNIMVTRAGAAKLLDFGIAREMKDSVTRVTGKETSGTLLYMSPEQFQGHTPTPSSDIYSFAATLYECLAGHPPFYQGSIGHQLLHMEPPTLRDVSADVNAAVQAALAKAPKDRPSSAAVLVERLRNADKPPAAMAPKPEPARASDTARRTAPLVYTAWPFGAQEAQRRQAETAQAFGVPVKKTLTLGGGVTLDLVLVPAGTFTMGSHDGDADEKPPHTVTIGRPFYMGVKEVTQGQWQAVMRSNPSYFSASGRGRGKDKVAGQDTSNLPVETVSWNEAQEFCRALSERSRSEGLTVRLPTEAEWEYACRAGSAAAYSFGDSEAQLGEYAWFDENSGGKTQPVGTRQANAWGLHDMHGNVWEWCADAWHDSYQSAPADGSAWTAGGSSPDRVLRGGSWNSDGRSLRSAVRDGASPSTRWFNGGFRVVVGVSAAGTP